MSFFQTIQVDLYQEQAGLQDDVSDQDDDDDDEDGDEVVDFLSFVPLGAKILGEEGPMWIKG